MITTLARVAVTLLAGAAIAVAGAGVASAAPAAAPATVAPAATQSAYTLTPTSITGFTWVAGQESWKQASYSRLGRSTFVVGSNGSFTMRQADGFPTLSGTVDDSGAFDASWSSSTGSTGSQNAEVTGQITISGTSVTMSMTYTAGMAMAANVNDTQYGTNSSKAFQATLELGVS